MRVEIMLHSKQIYYDVGMITHVVMNREIASGATHEQAFNYANTDDYSGEVHLTARFKENAIFELVAAMGKYINEDQLESENTFEKADAETHTFILDVPEKFRLSYVDPLRTKMHEYVVNRILYDWFMSAKPDEARIYEEKYNSALDKAKSYLNKRTGMSRLKPYPLI